MTGHRKSVEDKVVKRVPRKRAVRQRSSGIKIDKQLYELIGDTDVMAPLLNGASATRASPAADSLQGCIIRRQIEMYREVQLLHQQLLDSFDP
jgi:hypothetical protein